MVNILMWNCYPVKNIVLRYELILYNKIIRNNRIKINYTRTIFFTYYLYFDILLIINKKNKLKAYNGDYNEIQRPWIW